MSLVVNRVRLDRWLWAARVFKTRAQASQAITGGKVHVNGARAKAAKLVQIGDAVRIRKGPFEFQLTVRGVSERRGPPRAASVLFEEDPDGRRLREQRAEQLRLAPSPAYGGKGRPTKKERRDIERLRDADG
jgi:ribosome-associated heat shock protein Hsp15